jgi:hypothetical protein
LYSAGGLHSLIQLRALHLAIQHQASAEGFRLQQLQLLELGLAAVQRALHAELHDEAIALRFAVPEQNIKKMQRSQRYKA